MPQLASKEKQGSQPSKPWWREPWPWILMAGPAAAIIGCIITIFLAVQNFSDQAIMDGGIKRGLVVSKPATTDTPSPPQPAPSDG